MTSISTLPRWDSKNALLRFAIFANYWLVVFSKFVGDDLNISKCRCKTKPNSIKNDDQIRRKSSKINQNGAKKRSKIDLGSKSVKTVTASTGQNLCSGTFLQAFGATWVILGAILGTTERQGVPKSSILAPGCFKKSKNKVPLRVPEKHDFLMGSLTENVRFLKALSPPKCFIYKHFGGFRPLRTNRRFHEHRCQNVTKSDPKFDIWPLRGRPFHTLVDSKPS